MSELLLGNSLKFGVTDTPTREGEVVQKFEDIYNIPTPVVGMSVFVRETEKSYIVKSLKKENVGGKEVYTKVDKVICIEDEIEAIKTENVGRDAEIAANKVKVNALTNSLNSEVTRAQEAEAALNDLINGGEGSNAKYSTRFIGVFNNFSDLLAGIDSLIYDGSQEDKNLGSFRALLNQRIVEIKNVSLVRSGSSLVQVVSGPFEESNGSLSLSSTEYGIFSRIHDNTWSQWKRLTTTMGEVNAAISAAIAALIDKAPENLDTLKEIADWIEEHGNKAANMLLGIQQNTTEINTIKSSAITEIGFIKSPSLSGARTLALTYSTISGGAAPIIEIPAATTGQAGVMSAADKVSLDSIPDELEKLKDGDTIVGQAREIHSRNGKTVTDSFLSRTTAGSGTIGDGVATLKSVGGSIVKNINAKDCISSIENGKSSINDGVVVVRRTDNSMRYGGYLKNVIPANHVAYLGMCVMAEQAEISIYSVRSGYAKYAINGHAYVSHRGSTTAVKSGAFFVSGNNNNLYIFNIVHIDLTEMFGAGNEPTQAECDKLFGTMYTLPQGLTVAKPTEFKSTGFNQFNPDNVLDGKAIVDNAIVSGSKQIAVIPCLPCKVGVGENNGYCIHGDFGEDIKVYLTPLNPMEVDGELYMHELTKDSTTDTYVPLIKGYMLVEVPTTANLCAHFLWSEDKCERDSYEPYFESKIALPTIPQMSEWGLAGIQTSNALACDEIDLKKGVYRKKIIKYVFNGGASEVWYKTGTSTFYNPKLKKINKRDSLGNHCILISYSGLTKHGGGDNSYSLGNEANGIFYINPTFTNITEVNAWRDYLAQNPLELYYELAEPEEYPILKVDNNYISSDYGVEQFDSAIPCNANNLYYMRSLAGETRNFLDRMYDNTAKTDAKEVADYITNGIEGNKELATNAPNLALRALFVAAGAEYNDSGADITKTAPWGESVTHKNGHYYLNGLGDITEEQMIAIYNAPYNIKSQGVYEGQKIRTAFFYPDYGWASYNLKLLFCNSTIEVFGTFVNRWGAKVETLNASDVSYMFLSCSKLRYCNLIIAGATNLTGVVQGCANLELFRIKGVKSNLILSACSKISKESVLYIIQNATPTSAITITLHADAYARLANDADIVAALEAKPLVTLVSA